MIDVTEKSMNEIFCCGRHVRLVRELDKLLPVDNLAACGHWVLRVEGWIANNHFEHDGADTPPIAFHAIAIQITSTCCLTLRSDMHDVLRTRWKAVLECLDLF